MLNAVATILGCLALVVMIATVVRVVMVKLWESAKVNPEYVQSVYDNTHEHPGRGGERAPAAQTHQNLSLSQTASAAPMAEDHIAQNQPSPSASSVSDRDGGLHLVMAADKTGVSGIQDIESKRQNIESTLRGFFESSTLEARLSYVRDVQRVRPLMERFHSTTPLPARAWKGLGWVLPVEEPGFRLGYAEATFAEGEPVSLIIEEMADGTFRVDWESSVRYGELGWNEFIQTRPTAPKLFRVIASRPRHAPVGEAPQGSEVLEIRHPDDDHVVYAYFDRLDPKFQSLLQQLQTGNWKDVPLTLRLCYTAPAEGGRGVRIADVEGKGWLILQGTRS